MPYENYLNLGKDDRDQSVYRIMPIRWLLYSLQNKCLTLKRPTTWDDPFENVLLNSTFRNSSGNPIEFGFRDRIYGQCWTLDEESDAMWRIYSPEMDGAKVKSSPKRLLNALMSHRHQGFPEVECFIGKVEYKSVDQLSKTDMTGLSKANGSGIAKTFLYKRCEFAHEREIRLLLCNHTSKEYDEDTYNFSIDPAVIFDEIVLDPRMDPELVAAFEDAIRKKGFGIEVSQSKLYRRPDKLIIDV